MKSRNYMLRKTALAAAVMLLVGGVSYVGSFTSSETGSFSVMSSAYAAEEGSGGNGGHKGAMGEGRGGQGGKGAGTQGHRGGKSMDEVLSEDEGSDSDRPAWAGNPGGEGRPGGGGNTNPGTTKGDVYGDMIMLLRDPETGEPILIDGLTQACTSADCSTYVPMVDGEVPEGTTTFEVEFGRASLARSPSNVVEHALEDALSTLTTEGAVITQDEAGRLVITVDGVVTTIDSPLANLALYVDLMTGLASSSTSATEAALLDSNLANLNTAASLLAAVADKTGDITLDFVVYNNVISGVVDQGDFYDFSTFKYVRDYDDVTYFYTLDGGATVLSATLDVDAYLQAINGTLPEGSAALFAAAADDALEVIELTHTEVYDLTATGELLPGTK